MVQKLILEHKRALGDTVLFAALVRDISLMYPSQYQIAVRTYWHEVWHNNPYVASFSKTEPGVRYLRIDYQRQLDGLLTGRFKQHFVTAFHTEFTRQTKIPLQCLHPKPDVHLTPEERDVRLIDDPYWVVLAGTKHDMAVKQWEYGRYQGVVDALRKDGFRFVQAGSSSNKNVQPRLDNVLNLVGRTGLRDFFRLIYQCEGAICPITSAMHLAAWADKPCVVVAGGREGASWEHYTNELNHFGPKCQPVRVPHRYLHTLGKLQCAPLCGCDKHLLTPRAYPGRKLCDQPMVLPTGQRVARCMDMVGVEEVVEAVKSYYDSGVLETPVKQNKTSTYVKLSGLTGNPPDPHPTSPAPSGELTLAVKPELYARAEQAQKAKPKPKPRPTPKIVPANQSLLDNPIIGGKFTICVLTYGDYSTLSKRCLDSIVRTLPADRMSLRVGLNEPSVANEEVVTKGSYPIEKLYLHRENAMKYPVMREMFHDPACPIETNYLIWFDDDSYVLRDDWWIRLSQLILEGHSQNRRMYGHLMYHPMNVGRSKDPRNWFKQAPWYRDRPWRTKQGQPAPNGHCIWFCVGGFWALEVRAMRDCDIPDPRLYHNGGDITIGEQLWQGGYGMQQFNAKKEYVKTSGAARRGFREEFQWYRV